ncbi:MAG: RiPP maturation radical SAM C-methyltransferase [Lachnospiraceae bacterium]|nr:RiPP maturation radical SAM C-methyltransferase [Lachnospiraceae bacterium]
MQLSEQERKAIYGGRNIEAGKVCATRETETADVCLVMPPVAFGTMPSLALGILKNCLKQEHLSCYVDYANMHFTHAMGPDGFAGIYHGSLHGFLGEYIFNEVAGITNPYSIDEFIHYQLGDKDNTLSHLNMKNILMHGIRVAHEETERTVDRILERKPKIVGCTAVFEQRNAALAILKRVKERRPDVVTLMGGFACFNYGGMAMLKAFPFLDYVFCGESDDIFGPCCKGMIEGTLTELPYGLLRQGDPFPEKPPHRIVENMDLVPAPDYDDYVEALKSWYGLEQYQLVQKRTEMRLLLETSRGCWWGEKKNCAFCGLNGQHLHHRQKSADKALKEIRETLEKYDNRHICFADNILPMAWFKELIPALKAANGDDSFCFTAEIKANLRQAQVKALREAGYRILQPGIESLSDHILQLLNKGVSAIQNVALLKYARQYHMLVLWNALVGTVGETTADYDEQKEIFPFLEHLQPPENMWDIIYMRDSLYDNHQDAYGLKLVPDPVFKFLSPDDPDYVEKIAFHFVDENKKPDVRTTMARISFRNALNTWKKSWSSTAPLVRLDFFEKDGVLHMTDSRAVSKERSSELSGLARDVYRSSAEPVTLKSLLKTLRAQGCSEADEAITACLNALCERGLVLSLSGKYLALAVEVSEHEAESLSYREFIHRLVREPALKKAGLACDKNDPSVGLAALGREHGYIFRPETVNETDLVAPRATIDLYPWTYQYE